MNLVCLYLDSSRIFRWHLWLAEALAVMPRCEVSVVFSPQRHPLPKKCEILFALEHRIYPSQGDNALDQIDKTLIENTANANPDRIFDIVVDFAGDQSSLPIGRRVLSPCFNTIPGEIGAIFGLLNHKSSLFSPLLMEVRDSALVAPWTAHPADADEVLSQALNHVLSCAVRLILKAISTPVAQQTPSPNSIGTPIINPALTLQALNVFSHKMARYLEILVKGQKIWSVGWRINQNVISPITLLDTKIGTFSLLPDDGNRFYADPFPFRYKGEDFIFVEEFPFNTQRGCISVTKIENGKIGTPQPILEEPFHLSYPFIFEHDGEIWMIPETAQAHGIFLYRAEHFPDKWKQEACLIKFDGHDTTLLRHNGRLWLFTCEKAWNSSSWDILHLFYADKLTGPWIPHADNPVLFDPVLSRPAGAMFEHNGRIIRPVQDCSNGYGSAIIFCQIDTLNEGEFAQTPIGKICCQRRGCHTYNNHFGLEVIDVFGRQRGLTELTAYAKI